MKLVSVAEMQTIERQADASGLSYEQMMENAGHNLADAVFAAYNDLGDTSVLGLVGSGNNGGDTLVALSYLAYAGWKAAAYLVRPRPPEDPLVERLRQAGGEVIDGAADPDLAGLTERLYGYTVLLDGVLGTGTRLPLKPEVARVLDAARRALEDMDSPPYVVAVDCPSGVDLDTGNAAPECIRADLTITMAAVKAGLLRFPAFDKVGDLQVVGIGPIEHLLAYQDLRRDVVDDEYVRSVLPSRPSDSHKGTFGTALVAAGSVNYTGAALLAGEAAYRVGAGLVTLACPAPLHAALAGQFPEATWVLLPHDMGVISRDAASVLRNNLERATALLIGPGFGMEDTTREFLSRFLGASTSRRPALGFNTSAGLGGNNVENSLAPLPPLVIDADGLKLLSQIPNWPELLPPRSVLTPHPGEMSVLTGIPKEGILPSRFEVAERFAREWGHVVVLKGAFTVVADPEGSSAVIPVATPALARAGTGDVLAGIIAGLLAQGVDSYPAALAGAWIHAQAGLSAAEAMGNPASVLAGDVLNAVPDIMTALLQGR